eukprot:Colp12_sorted_trinity150504_noHs@20868
MRRPRWARQAALRRLTTRHMTDIGCYINLHVVHSRGGVDFDTELGVELVALSGELLVGGGVALGLDPADEVVQLGDSGNVVALGEGGLHGVDGLLQGVAHVDLAGKGQVLLSVALGIGNHALDVDVGQASAVSLDVGVDGLAQLDAAVEEGGQLLLEGRDAGGAADQHHVTDGVNGGASVAKHGLDGVNALGEVGLVELLEDGASDGHVEVLAVNEGIELNLGLVGIGEVSLGSLHSSAESLLRALTALHGLSGVLAVLLLNLLKRPVDKGVVEVLTSEVGVATGGLHGEHTALHGQHTHIEGTTSKIEDDHVGSVLLGSTVNSRGVQTVGQGSGGGLVDDAHHL